MVRVARQMTPTEADEAEILLDSASFGVRRDKRGPCDETPIIFAFIP